MARGQERTVMGGRGMISAALKGQVAGMAESSNRIREAAQRSEQESRFQGPAALGAGIARGVEMGVSAGMKKEELALQQSALDAEIENKHKDRVSREQMHGEMIAAQGRQTVATINAAKARQEGNFTHEKELLDMELEDAWVRHYINKTSNTKMALYQLATTQELAQQGIGVAKDMVHAMERQSEHERTLVQPVIDKQIQTKERLQIDLDVDMFKDVPEGAMSPGSKVLDNELKRIGVTSQQLSTSNTAGLIKMVQDGDLTPTEIAELKGILPEFAERLSELLRPVKEKAAEKEVKGFVGRRIPFEGPLSDEEIKRRLKAGEEDPWYEKVLGPTSGFFERYEMEMPVDPKAAGVAQRIRKELDKVQDMQDALTWLANSDEARAAKMPAGEAGATPQSVADVVDYIGKPLSGMGYGSFLARAMAKWGDDPNALSKGLLQDWVEFQTTLNDIENAPPHLREKIKARLKGLDTYKNINGDLDDIFRQIQQGQGQQGALGPRAYEAAAGAGIRTMDLQRQKKNEEFGLRPDGTQKGGGFLGVLELKGGGVATEYSVGVKLEANERKETDIPTLVPTLTQEEISLMVNDIIPNRKPIPEKILQKAVDHANKRVKQGKSPFAGGNR